MQEGHIFRDWSIEHCMPMVKHRQIPPSLSLHKAVLTQDFLFYVTPAHYVVVAFMGQRLYCILKNYQNHTMAKAFCDSPLESTETKKFELKFDG